jgi:outer membrane receptor protein involved in Fe transport
VLRGSYSRYYQHPPTSTLSGPLLDFALKFGSGFLLGDGPDHLPAHTTGDVAGGKALNSRVALRFTATNIADKQYLTGFENSFAGTHWAAPRELAIQLRYKFNY